MQKQAHGKNKSEKRSHFQSAQESNPLETDYAHTGAISYVSAAPRNSFFDIVRSPTRQKKRVAPRLSIDSYITEPVDLVIISPKLKTASSAEPTYPRIDQVLPISGSDNSSSEYAKSMPSASAMTPILPGNTKLAVLACDAIRTRLPHDQHTNTSLAPAPTYTTQPFCPLLPASTPKPAPSSCTSDTCDQIRAIAQHQPANKNNPMTTISAITAISTSPSITPVSSITPRPTGATLATATYNDGLQKRDKTCSALPAISALPSGLTVIPPSSETAVLSISTSSSKATDNEGGSPGSCITASDPYSLLAVFTIRTSATAPAIASIFTFQPTTAISTQLAGNTQ